MDHNEVIAEGLRAFAGLQRNNKRGFNQWLAVGEGLNAGKAALIERLKLNSFDNSTIGRKAFALWLRESGYVAVPSEARNALAKILEPGNLPRIREWYETLGENQKLRLHHPTRIWAAWQGFIGSKIRTNPVVVSMTLSSRKGIVKRISEVPQGVQLSDYIGLIADLVGFLSEKYEISERSILDAITEGIGARTGERVAA